MIYCSARLTQINESIVSHPSERQRGQESLVSGFAELLFVRGGQPERADSLLETVRVDVPERLRRGEGAGVQVLAPDRGHTHGVPERGRLALLQVGRALADVLVVHVVHPVDALLLRALHLRQRNLLAGGDTTRRPVRQHALRDLPRLPFLLIHLGQLGRRRSHGDRRGERSLEERDELVHDPLARVGAHGLGAGVRLAHPARRPLDFLAG
mmetsp:Transcript_4447/g.19982  ORF Transcript_4447/g.19982 Transcript_4447/m.19982 type:complete len:211 (-) Transcript_4447:407-1039(-)